MTLNMIPPHNMAKPANNRFRGTSNLASCGVADRNGATSENKKDQVSGPINVAVELAKSTVAAGLVGSESRDTKTAFRQ